MEQYCRSNATRELDDSLAPTNSIKLAQTSLESITEKLPLPHQINLLIGLSARPFDELRKYAFYKMRSFRAEMPPLPTRSAAVKIISTLLAAMAFFADTAIHAFT
jgi:hypothetical protein